MSENIVLWQDLANALMIFGLIVFASGLGFGVILGLWCERRADSKRQRAWLTRRTSEAEAADPDMAAVLRIYSRHTQGKERL